jgi:hypothetical protein
MSRHLLLPVVLLLGAVSCGPSVVAQSELLTTRLLAIRADPPELLAFPDGGVPPPVHFTALAVQADGGTPEVTFAVCLAGDPFDATFQCPGVDGITLPDDTLDVSSPEIQPLLEAFDGGLPPNGLPTTEPGVVQIAIGYLATNGGTAPGDSERGIYRLGVRFSGRPNHNPELLGVTVPDGGSLAGALLPATQEIRLDPHIPDGGPDSAWPSIGIDGGIETYTSFDGGLAYENLNYTWYASTPDVVDFRSREPTPGDTAETAYSRFNGNVVGPVTFYVVLRDGRGGTDWLVMEATSFDAGVVAH